MTASTALYWFRRDLRLEDNPALRHAANQGAAIIPVYIHDESADGQWQEGGASRWWLHHSLRSLFGSLEELGSRLIVRSGDSGKILKQLIDETGAEAVYWNRRYEPSIIERDKSLKKELRAERIEVESFNGALLFEPHTIANKQGNPFQVFTPYWRHCLAKGITRKPAPAVKTLSSPSSWPRSLAVEELGLLPKLNWADGMEQAWQPGEDGAQKRLQQLVKSRVDQYEAKRDFPSVEGTSRLSPHLHFGEISPLQIWESLRKRNQSTGVFPSSKGETVFLSEVGWREFAHHLLFHFPETPESPLRTSYEKFPWADDQGGHKLKAWQKGLTGYPIVDAGMRELWATGWMHNRVRMIVASFLVKHLRLPWQKGSAWFWDTLVDADLANNTLGWQWSAGCGADAAPYFRIFSPISQGERFDKKGDYVKRWVPELKKLETKYIHRPWEAPGTVLEQSGIELGKTYPEPIVVHETARDKAMAAWKEMRASE